MGNKRATNNNNRAELIYKNSYIKEKNQKEMNNLKRLGRLLKIKKLM
jgi:hypothetical protein